MAKMKKAALLLASMALAVLLACTPAVLTAAPGVGQTTTTVTLVGAGDIASCSSDRDKATANVLAVSSLCSLVVACAIRSRSLPLRESL
jgi:hypothetical protein